MEGNHARCPARGDHGRPRPRRRKTRQPLNAKVALITGAGGQDGIYLARLLCREGYRVVGTCTPADATREPVRRYLSAVELVQHDLRDRPGFDHLLETYQPTEIYNLGAFSSVGESWRNAELVGEVNGMAVLRMLEAIRSYRDRHGQAPRYYQASTSEIFGIAPEQPQRETTPHHPRSPYAAAKSFAHHLTVNYRESYGLYACNGILYNHESPLRGPQFVTRKITRAAAEIALGRRDDLTLGNLDVRRDWGAAEDYVRAMHAMLKQDEPDDYIVATGVSHSLAELLQVAFAAADIADPQRHLRHDPVLMRPAEVVDLRGDASKARQQLGWSPSIPFEDLITHMVRIEFERMRTGIEEDPRYL